MKPTKSTPPPDSESPDSTKAIREKTFQVLEAISDPVSVVDKDLNIVFLNSRMRTIVGDILGMKCSESVLGSPDICSMCPVKSDWDYSKGPLVRRAIDLDGRLCEYAVTRYEDPETGEFYWVSIEKDITEKSRIEARLATLAAAFDQMAEAVCVAETDGHLAYTNKAFVQLTGFDHKGVADLSMSESSAGGSGATIQTIMRTAAERGWEGEMTGLKKDGTRYYTHVVAKPVRDESKAVVGVVGILQDVTRQKKEEAEQEKYTSQLEARMEARTTELARKVSQLTTINKISRVVTSILDIDELMNEFVKSIAQGFGYPHVIMMLADKGQGDLYLKAVYGRHMDLIPKDLRQKLKEGIIGHAAYFGETLVSGDVDVDPRYLRKALIGTRSELAVPVTFRGEILGVLDVQSDVRDAFTRNDVNIVEMLADMLANSLTNARMYTESKEREAALSVLDRISKQISYRLEPTVVLDQVARDAATLLRAEKAVVGLVDRAAGALRWVAPYKMDKEKLSSLKFSSERGVTGRALKWLKTEVVNDYTADPDAVERDAKIFDIRSMVSAPLSIEGRGIGIINVYNKIGNKPFTKSDALFLSSLADHAAIALENANLLSSLNQRVHSQLALLETAITMQRQLDSGSTYELVADRLREVVAYDGLTFYRVDYDSKMLVPVLARGLYTEEIMAEKFPVGTGITGYVAKSGKPELVNDTLSDSRMVLVSGTPDEKEAIMAIPLTGKDRVIGVLALYRERMAEFSPQEFEIAQLFASQASVAVENAELYGAKEGLLADSRRKVEQMAKVLELTTSVMYMDDLDRLLQRMCDVIVQSFGFRRASIGLSDPEQEVYVVRATAGYPDWVRRGSTRPMKKVLGYLKDECKVGATSYYVKYEQQSFGIEEFPFLAHPELADKPRATFDAWHERDIMMTVFKDSSGRMSGYLSVDEPADLKIPSQNQIEVLEILAGIASIAVENTKAYQKQVMAANEIALLNDIMTHDINNFNQGIMGYIELLLQDKRLDDNQKKYAERALLQVRNNARLIDNIRKLAKIRMMSDADFVPIDLQSAIVEAADAVAKVTTDKNVNVESALPLGKHFILGNQYAADLFLNIISNAVKFDSSRRVRVDISISEETAANTDYWVVSVADRGRGIPDERKKVVFERFATGMTGIKGFGLGLSIVSAIVDKYGGRIWVEDRIKADFTKGSVFKIVLPKATPPDETGKSQPIAAESTASSPSSNPKPL